MVALGTSMKVCVFGAGAIGSKLAVRLIRSGKAEVSVVTRGAHLAAIRRLSAAMSLPDHVLPAG